MTQKTVLLVALALFMSILLVSCGKKYSAEPIEAWVIDAKTRKPIEGVIIVANWELHKSTVGGRIPGGQLNVLETVTDKAGRFFFSGWGPKWTWRGYLDHEDPTLLFYKAGYKYRSLGNPLRSDVNHSAVRRSMWHGKTIELQPFKGVGEEYAKHLGFLNNNLYPLLGSETCDWKKIPRMLLALSEQSRVFRKTGINALYDVLLYLPVSERKCGSPKAFFEGYQP